MHSHVLVVFIYSSWKNILKYKTKSNKNKSLIIGRKCLGETRTNLPETNITFTPTILKFNDFNINLNNYDRLKKL